MVRSRVLLAAAAALILLPAASPATTFSVTPLVSDGIVRTNQPADPQLLNPWGISFPPGGPFWVSDNGSGFSTLYNGLGVKQGLIVPMSGNAPPPNQIPITGQVFNPNSANFGGALFIFAGENGAIYTFPGNPASPTAKTAGTDVYKGLALSGSTLIATNFNTGNLDLFTGTITANPTRVPGPPAPPSLAPNGTYAPFNVANLNGTIYVTFALQDAAKHDDVPGTGFIETFNLSNNSFKLLTADSHLSSPWGMVIAPSTFGQFAGDLLVGNFGDGTINAFDPVTGAFRGTLLGVDGQPLVIDGLWALTLGSGSATAPTNRVFFTAGPNGESDGIFGTIDAVVPEPTSAALFLVGGAGLLLFRRRKAQPV
jgi:uncharacterized protein (TIGR03118 family)